MSSDSLKYLDSTQHAVIVQVLEMVRQQLGAHWGYAHTTLPGLPAEGTVATGLSPEIARTLNLSQWHTDEGSLIRYCMGEAEHHDQVIRPLALRGISPMVQAALFRRFTRHRQLGDVLAAVISLSGHHAITVVFARWAGANSFVESDERVMEGLIRRLPARLTQARAASAAPPRVLTKVNGRRALTNTESVVLDYLRQSLTEVQIANELSRSPHTVHVHVKSIYLKYGVSSRKELLARLQAQELQAEAPGGASSISG
ncbi:helix-turn-helix transcriptional regulator [Mucisphaera calidilacus]|nr:LuxR C-terminal-related transcriptional regulator [Mucisphaera calidilacus]